MYENPIKLSDPEYLIRRIPIYVYVCSNSPSVVAIYSFGQLLSQWGLLVQLQHSIAFLAFRLILTFEKSCLVNLFFLSMELNNETLIV